MRTEDIFTRAFINSSFRPYKFYLVVYDKNGVQAEQHGHVGESPQKTGKSSKKVHRVVKRQKTQGQAITEAKKGIKTKAGKARTSAKAKKKTLEVNIRRHTYTGKILRQLQREGLTSRTLHKKVHLQSHLAVRKDKHPLPVRKVQRVSSRKSSRVPKMDGKQVRRRSRKAY